MRSRDVIPDFVAGHSLGEYSALCAAGVTGIEDTLSLVTKRGQLMHAAGKDKPSGMRAVLGLSINVVQDVLKQVTADGVVTVGNHNSEKQVVISGDFDALDEASQLLSKKKGKVIPLNVSLANHSPIVAAAVPEFEEVMASIDFHEPSIPVIFNVTAEGEREPEKIRTLMARQIASMVRWHEIITALFDKGVRIFIEAGPKKVLSGLVKKIAPPACDYRVMQFDTPDTLKKCLEAMGR